MSLRGDLVRSARNLPTDERQGPAAVWLDGDVR